MKKIITSFIVVVMLLVSIPVSASTGDNDRKIATPVTDNVVTIEKVDPVTGEIIQKEVVRKNFAVTQGNETRYDAKELRYEIRDANDNLTSILNKYGRSIPATGNFGSLAESTSLLLLDFYSTGKYITLPFGYSITVYPEGSTGFYVAREKHYFTAIQLGKNDAAGAIRMELVDQGTDYGYIAGWIFNGNLSQVAQNPYSFPGSSGSHFKMKFTYINGPYESVDIHRLNFVSYSF